MNNATNFLRIGSDHLPSLLATAELTKSNAYFLTIGVLFAIYLVQGYIKSNNEFKAPFVGYRSVWEPILVVSCASPTVPFHRSPKDTKRYLQCHLFGDMPFLMLCVVQEWHVQDLQK